MEMGDTRRHDIDRTINGGGNEEPSDLILFIRCRSRLANSRKGDCAPQLPSASVPRTAT